MYSTQGGANGNHIHMRILLAEEATLKSSMDGFNLGITTEKVLVGGYCHLQNV